MVKSISDEIVRTVMRHRTCGVGLADPDSLYWELLRRQNTLYGIRQALEDALEELE